MSILDYIGFGKANAVTRDQLCAWTGLSDRAIRKLIEIARNQGAVIINNQDGEGYYQSDDLQDLLAQYRTNHSRAMSILRQQKYLKRKIAELNGSDQLKMDEVDANEAV